MDSGNRKLNRDHPNTRPSKPKTTNRQRVDGRRTGDSLGGETLAARRKALEDLIMRLSAERRNVSDLDAAQNSFRSYDWRSPDGSRKWWGTAGGYGSVDSLFGPSDDLGRYWDLPGRQGGGNERPF